MYVLLVDNQQHVFKAISETFYALSDIKFIGRYADALDFTVTDHALCADIALLNADSLARDLFPTVQALQEQCPKLKLVAFGDQQDDDTVSKLICEGVVGIFSTAELLKTLPQALRTIHAGKTVVTSALMRRLVGYSTVHTDRPCG